MQCAARYDGMYPHELSLDQFRQVIERVEQARGTLVGFDIAATVTRTVIAAALEAIGVTWAMYGLWTDATPARAMQLIESRRH